MKILVALVILAAPLVVAQTPTKTDPAQPTVNETTKIALQSLAEHRQQLYQQLNQIQQQELNIEREFTEAHPGWEIDQLALRNNILNVKKVDPPKTDTKSK